MSLNDRPGVTAEGAPTLFIGKWTVAIVNLLRERPHRHGELRRRLRKISQRMLTRTLRNLESTGLISRHVKRSRSVAVEYSLTKLGKEFTVPLGGMCRWAGRHGKKIAAAIDLSKRGSGSRSPMQV